MSDIKFLDEEDSRIPQRPNTTRGSGSKFVDFLVSKNIVKNARQANLLLIAIIFVITVAIIVINLNTFSSPA